MKIKVMVKVPPPDKAWWLPSHTNWVRDRVRAKVMVLRLRVVDELGLHRRGPASPDDPRRHHDISGGGALTLT